MFSLNPDLNLVILSEILSEILSGSLVSAGDCLSLDRQTTHPPKEFLPAMNRIPLPRSGLKHNPSHVPTEW